MKKPILNFLLSGMLIFGAATIAGAQNTTDSTETETTGTTGKTQIDTTTTVITDTTTAIPDTAGITETPEVAEEEGGVSGLMIATIVIVAVVGGVVVYKLVSKKK
ncbi:MAG: hypothetical protein Q8862_06365 [Bacteroidota bacterium]|nr:hypothetical protein [Bacteroidota bacterium]MDP4206401.1 hypothetical protein [Bacteroidota bacterium]